MNVGDVHDQPASPSRVFDFPKTVSRSGLYPKHISPLNRTHNLWSAGRTQPGPRDSSISPINAQDDINVLHKLWMTLHRPTQLSTSCDTMSSTNTLRSGIRYVFGYVIHSVLDPKNDERFIMIPDSDSRDATGQVPVKTQLDQIYKVRSSYPVNDTYCITCSGPSPITNMMMSTR